MDTTVERVRKGRVLSASQPIGMADRRVLRVAVVVVEWGWVSWSVEFSQCWKRHVGSLYWVVLLILFTVPSL